MTDIIPQTTFIYKLIDPETLEIRYIGKANDPADRLKQHIAHSQNQSKDTHAGHWIASLCKRDLKPLLEIIEEVPFAIWETRELYWIEWHLQHGHPLTNTYFGGKGVGMVPPVVRAKMSKARKGKSPTPAAIAKAADARRGFRHTPEAKEKIAAARHGKTSYTPSPEVRAKISKAHRGRKRGPLPENRKREVSEFFRGRKQSPEHIAKRTAPRPSKKHSPEARANISRAKKRANAMKRNPPDAPTLFD